MTSWVAPDHLLAHYLEARLSAAPVVEHVLLSILPGQEQAFEAAFVAGHRAISAAAGHEWACLVRQVEEPSTYLLLVGWTSLEAHTVDFRGSDLFAEWRAAVGSFFAAPPKLTHFVAESVGGDRAVLGGRG